MCSTATASRPHSLWSETTCADILNYSTKYAGEATATATTPCTTCKVRAVRYLRDVAEADKLIDSTLFRPPHGLLRWKQAAALKEHFNIVMYDLVTRDYSKKLTPDEVFDNVRRYARNGSIIVFHDSIKAGDNMRQALPRAIEWLLEQGYEFQPIPM